MWASEAPGKKASATGPLIALQSLRQPVWQPRDMAAFAREGYAENPIVYRSVRMIAEAAASVPLLLYAGDHEIESHPLLDLVRRPNPVQSGTDLIETFVGHLLVTGNAYLEAVAVGGELEELHALRPDRVKVVPGPDGWPEAWDYTAAGRTVRIQAEPAPGIRPVLHLRLFHAADDHYGMSPLEPAAAAIDLHNTASRWNKALLDNSARPSGALVYTARDGNLTGEQYERLKAELEQGFQGAANAGRPLLLEGGLDWKSMSLSPKDMDFNEARHGAAREIALALGVPPMLLGIPGDNTYSNLAEAQRILWRQTVLPLVTKLATALTNWLAPAYTAEVPGFSLAPSTQAPAEPGTPSTRSPLRLVPDLDHLPALAPEREALWSSLEKLSFLTPDEKRAAIGYAPLGETPETDPADKLFNPAQLRIPAGQPGGGQWTTGDGTPVEPTNRRRFRNASPADQARLDAATRRAEAAARRTEELDPTWRAPHSVYGRDDIQGAIRHQETVERAARSRYEELTRDAVPGANPSWGVNRLTKELHDRGYVLRREARGDGLIYTNYATREEVRIMERPPGSVRANEPPQKYYFSNYYKYRFRDDQKWGAPVPIPNK